MESVAIKDLKPGDRVLTTAGEGTIRTVNRCPFMEGKDSFEVTWQVNGEDGQYIGNGNDRVQIL